MINQKALNFYKTVGVACGREPKITKSDTILSIADASLCSNIVPFAGMEMTHRQRRVNTGKTSNLIIKGANFMI